VTLAIRFFGETSSITLWLFVPATSRDSWALPFQKIQPRQILLRISTGVRSFYANEIMPPLPLPPPASTWACPGQWQLSQAFPNGS
jgi:hypothetical protein